MPIKDKNMLEKKKEKSVAKERKVTMVGVKFKSKINGGREETAGSGTTLSLFNSSYTAREI